ncbi:MAG TPA: MarR family winged helix-turn-helix transcriptional regulator [Amaricoccus sp.]|uniref:MarR family winged helix-turn-helix transcriptional regulator n=1 Tax=Amaricoccus sp. TaxID=1872485 RepID=UPI002C6F176C|nr:MarR family winged helix-turn-helix transcriptional regulator [Amaricoccus sp.]HMQ94549.1 MarR family winged helix-turn-helix transcriptional regulator [Amaricoccus sp.]HMR51315.1 MarR family winged helix-turn-helix transcriptional regulator [Amaricoccus sp.]HMR61346.1 MarR family winged helix-turn-helix transcriptional regulator [Amaricoccus sp.]HMT98241.1 MarR family winged helix-turn-helix transcriptional regulator [Amaricoccus sp.]
MSSESRQIVTAFQRLALFWRASQWQVAREFGLNPTQGEVLARVAARPEWAADLAAALGISHASLSDTVSALDRKGLVRRRSDPDDGRARRIEATGAGTALAARMPEAPAALEEAIARLTEAERGGLLRSLVLIIRSLQEARAIPVQRMCLTCRHFRPHIHDDPVRPHHCAFVDAAFGDAALRLDCADHETATDEEAARAWAALSVVG